MIGQSYTVLADLFTYYSAVLVKVYLPIVLVYKFILKVFDEIPLVI